MHNYCQLIICSSIVQLILSPHRYAWKSICSDDVITLTLHSIKSDYLFAPLSEPCFPSGKLIKIGEVSSPEICRLKRGRKTITLRLYYGIKEWFNFASIGSKDSRQIFWKLSSSHKITKTQGHGTVGSKLNHGLTVSCSAGPAQKSQSVGSYSQRGHQDSDFIVGRGNNSYSHRWGWNSGWLSYMKKGLESNNPRRFSRKSPRKMVKLKSSWKLWT